MLCVVIYLLKQHDHGSPSVLLCCVLQAYEYSRARAVKDGVIRELKFEEAEGDADTAEGAMAVNRTSTIFVARCSTCQNVACGT